MNDTNGFDEWFRIEYPRVLSAVLVVCAGDVQRAEDAAADGFVRALERWGRVSQMDAPGGWVTKVAINRAKRSYRFARLTTPLHTTSEPRAPLEPEAQAPVWHALTKLSVRQRAAIVLRYVEDQTQAQIAAQLDIAPGTAAATLHQARRKLRIELEGDT